MNKASAYRITNARLLKNYIFGALIRYTAGTLQNILIIILGLAMLFPRRWPVLHKLLSIHLAPLHLCAGKGLTGTFNAGRVLDDFLYGPLLPLAPPAIACLRSVAPRCR